MKLPMIYTIVYVLYTIMFPLFSIADAVVNVELTCRKHLENMDRKIKAANGNKKNLSIDLFYVIHDRKNTSPENYERECYKPIITKLVNAGANANFIFHTAGETILSQADISDLPDEVLEHLISLGAEANKPNYRWQVSMRSIKLQEEMTGEKVILADYFDPSGVKQRIVHRRQDAEAGTGIWEQRDRNAYLALYKQYEQKRIKKFLDRIFAKDIGKNIRFEVGSAVQTLEKRSKRHYVFQQYYVVGQSSFGTLSLSKKRDGVVDKNIPRSKLHLLNKVIR